MPLCIRKRQPTPRLWEIRHKTGLHELVKKWLTNFLNYGWPKINPNLSELIRGTAWLGRGLLPRVPPQQAI